MAGHRFGSANRNFVSVFAEDLFDRPRLAKVANIGRGRVGIDVINLTGRNPRMLKRESHGSHSTFAVRRWRGHVIGVRASSVACKLAINSRASGLSMFQLFHYKNT